ncbi:MAG: nitroreductase family protein [Paracoccaceae bacterium]
MTDNPAEPLDFMLARRSTPARLLGGPVPDRITLTRILTAAARTPDHGKLVPWRFIVLERAALDRLAALAGKRAGEQGLDADKAQKGVAQFAQSPLCVAVVQVPRPTVKVPMSEQTYSAGAACYGLLIAALAGGYAANWLTGWPAYDRDFLREGLGIAADETLVGFVHVGTTTDVTAPDRPRPALSDIVSWMA